MSGRRRVRDTVTELTPALSATSTSLTRLERFWVSAMLMSPHRASLGASHYFMNACEVLNPIDSAFIRLYTKNQSWRTEFIFREYCSQGFEKSLTARLKAD